MAIVMIPTRQVLDVIDPTDINTLMANDIDLDTRIHTIEASYFTLIKTTQDVVNNNSVANTLMDTGLQFDAVTGATYALYVCCIYNAAATTTGSRWVINGTATISMIGYVGYTALTATTQTITYANAYGLPSACNASSAYTTGNIATIEGIISTSSNGIIKVQFASEEASSAITCKAGSYMLVRRLT